MSADLLRVVTLVTSGHVFRVFSLISIGLKPRCFSVFLFAHLNFGFVLMEVECLISSHGFQHGSCRHRYVILLPHPCSTHLDTVVAYSPSFYFKLELAIHSRDSQSEPHFDVSEGVEMDWCFLDVSNVLHLSPLCLPHLCQLRDHPINEWTAWTWSIASWAIILASAIAVSIWLEITIAFCKVSSDSSTNCSHSRGVALPSAVSTDVSLCYSMLNFGSYHHYCWVLPSLKGVEYVKVKFLIFSCNK